MLEKAIPEGVLESGGQLSGFVYFERLDKRLKRIEFKADLINARTGIKFGSIHIPFVFQ
jgi:hypothetical protein